jgi:DNA-binding transcriptional ArsR family regulator
VDTYASPGLDHGRVLAALADDTRRRVLELLREGPMAVGQLAARLPVTRPAVSQHLRVLKEAGLVVEQRRGTRRLYSVDPRGAEPLVSYVDRMWGDALAGFASAARARARGRAGEPLEEEENRDERRESIR